MPHPLLPIDQKGMTCRDAASLFNGLAALMDSYPADGVVVTLNIEVADTGKAGTTAKPRKPRTTKT